MKSKALEVNYKDSHGKGDAGAPQYIGYYQGYECVLVVGEDGGDDAAGRGCDDCGDNGEEPGCCHCVEVGGMDGHPGRVSYGNGW